MRHIVLPEDVLVPVDETLQHFFREENESFYNLFFWMYGVQVFPENAYATLHPIFSETDWISHGYAEEALPSFESMVERVVGYYTQFFHRVHPYLYFLHGIPNVVVDDIAFSVRPGAVVLTLSYNEVNMHAPG